MYAKRRLLAVKRPIHPTPKRMHFADSRPKKSLHRLRIFSKNRIQLLPLHTVRILEARRERIERLLVQPDEMVRPLLHEELADQDVPRDARDALVDLPHGARVQVAVLRVDLGRDVRLERRVDVAHGGVVRAPRVDREAVLLGEERREALHVGRGRRDVDHALEADVFVQPDGPA
jgi:hypothetical protein